MFSNYGTDSLGLLRFGSETRASAEASVEAAFKRFYNGITLEGDQREICNSRRGAVIASLEKSFHILDSFATGSVPKFTALRKPYSDVDVMVVLHYGKHIQNKKPSEVLQAVRDVIGSSYTLVRKNGQAVTVYYKSWPNVDVVPVAVAWNDDGSVNYYLVPNMNTETWIKSRPRAHSSAIKDRASLYGPEFRRIVKMIKWWNLQHSEYLQSYHIEVLGLKILTGTFSNYSWDVYQFFKGACELVGGYLWYEDDWVDNYLGYSDRQEAVKRLETARDKALQAWYEGVNDNPDSTKAKRLWSQVFGSEFPTNG
ncbi:MAG: nucleotidyltransferase [Candidatus Melainabacteria bacterium]|nr:nucleotidyltransferase [Candidatus Melainabacteria bacterium]